MCWCTPSIRTPHCGKAHCLPAELREKPLTLEGLANLVRKAAEALEAAQKEESIARNATTAALNGLNHWQQKFDAAVNELKKNAPRESTWQADVRRLDQFFTK